MYDPLSDIQQYSAAFSISQVVKFFDKKALGITRAMIQNYIRDGLLPPPVNKRQYTHKHLAALTLIDYLKTVFEMSDIKKVLCPLMDEEGLPLETYNMIVKRLSALSETWKADMSPFFFDEDSNKSVSYLLLMTHAADLKALSQSMLV